MNAKHIGKTRLPSGGYSLPPGSTPLLFCDGARGEDIAGRHWENLLELHERVRAELHGKVDLSRVDKETEEQLYACVVLEYFTPRPLSQPGVVLSPPCYSPQQAGLRVFFESGSWYATWTRLKEPLFQPVEQRWTWLKIEATEPGLLRFLDATTPPILQRESECPRGLCFTWRTSAGIRSGS